MKGSKCVSCSCSKGSKHPGLHQEDHWQQVKAYDPFLLLSTGETTSVPSFGLLVRERRERRGASPAKGHRNGLKRFTLKNGRLEGPLLMCINT